MSELTRRQRWQIVLDAELARWSAMTWEQLIAELTEVRVYQVPGDGFTYQVEVELLQRTHEYLNVMVSVDDGILPASILPATATFLKLASSPGT